MEIGKNDNTDFRFQFPELTRFNAVKLSGESFSRSSGLKIESKIRETIQVAVQSADIKENQDARLRTRILVLIRFEGSWREKTSARELAVFDGTYQATFNFKEEIAESVVEEAMNHKIYRDFLAAQAYPLAKSNLFSQLLAFGISSNKKLGLDVNISNFEEIDESNEDSLIAPIIPNPL